jgi:hypothetical protein
LVVVSLPVFHEYRARTGVAIVIDKAAATITEVKLIIGYLQGDLDHRWRGFYSAGKRAARSMNRFAVDLVAIEAFKGALVRVRAGRSDIDHRGTAIRARMTFNLVGREAKQRFRRGHVAPPSINPNGKVYRWFHSGLDGKGGSGGPPLLLDGGHGSRPPADQRARLAAPLVLANAFAVDAGLTKQLPPVPDAVALHCSRLV